MRLIDADALPKYTGYALSAVEVAKAVENAPTIAASPWHRVEEKPDEHTNLWLHDERGNYHVGCVSTYRGYTEYIDMGGNTLHDIDYWMPIEPPKEDE
jgi:hypothetical protein